MDNDFDEFDEDVKEFDEEEKKPKKPKKIIKTPTETEETTERYVAFYQEPKVGIVDTLTKEVVIELADYTMAQLEAFKLNKLDKIGIASGVQ